MRERKRSGRKCVFNVATSERQSWENGAHAGMLEWRCQNDDTADVLCFAAFFRERKAVRRSKENTR
jgi:hypothetical protein